MNLGRSSSRSCKRGLSGLVALFIAAGVLVSTAGVAAADTTVYYPNPYGGPTYFQENGITPSAEKVNLFVATDFNEGPYAGLTAEARNLQIWHAETAVRYYGGIIQRQLGVEGTFVAEMPRAGYDLMKQSGFGDAFQRCANPISSAQLEAFKVNAVASPTGISTVNGIEPYNADLDPYSLKNVARAMGAESFWSAGFRGAYNNGIAVDVALIDTGLAPEGNFVPVPGTPISISPAVHLPDFSFDSNVSGLAHNDSVGHGTHMAGIINAVAPKARVLSIKLGDHDGAADVTQFIAAIDWVREHNNDYGMNIRVLNLSFGFVSKNKWTEDELSKAVDAAWKAGIVVVVSAGNERNNVNPEFVDPGILAPAYNKYAIAVGAYDTGLNVYSRSDDAPTNFTSGSVSDNKRLPDLSAPGSHIASLRTPGSAADDQITQSFCDMQMTDEAMPYPILNNGTLVRGSGTSQAAAAVSGAVALMLSKYPTLTPDALKNHLKKSTRPIPNSTRDKTGEGSLDLALANSTTVATTSTQSYDKVTGGYNIDWTRGDEWIYDATTPAAGRPTNGCIASELKGNCDIFGNYFLATTHASKLEAWQLNSTLRWAGCATPPCTSATGKYQARVAPGQTWVDRATPTTFTHYGRTLTAPAGQSFNGTWATWTALPAAGTSFVNKPTVGWAWPSVKWTTPSWSWRMWPDDASPAGYHVDNNGVFRPATDWKGIRWRAAGFDGFRWRDAGWDGFRWRDNAWVGFRWRFAPADGQNFDGYRWRDTAWNGARWK